MKIFIYSCLGLPSVRCSILHLDLFSFMRFSWAHIKSVQVPWMPSCPSVVSPALFSFTTSADLLRVHLSSLSMSSVKIFKNPVPEQSSEGHHSFQVVQLNPNPPHFSLRVKINLAIAPRRCEEIMVEVVSFNITDPRIVSSLSSLVASFIS